MTGGGILDEIKSFIQRNYSFKIIIYSVVTEEENKSRTKIMGRKKKNNQRAFFNTPHARATLTS